MVSDWGWTARVIVHRSQPAGWSVHGAQRARPVTTGSRCPRQQLAADTKRTQKGCASPTCRSAAPASASREHRAPRTLSSSPLAVLPAFEALTVCAARLTRNEKRTPIIIMETTTSPAAAVAVPVGAGKPSLFRGPLEDRRHRRHSARRGGRHLLADAALLCELLANTDPLAEVALAASAPAELRHGQTQHG
jgi:hypothetical protein